MAIHFIIIFHLLCMHDSYTMHMHAIGVPEGVTLLEFEQVLSEEQQQAQEQEVQAPEEGANEEVLECPDHQPSSFLKGKPRSILSLLISKMQLKYYCYIYIYCCIKFRCWMQTLAALVIQSLSRY